MKQFLPFLSLIFVIQNANAQWVKQTTGTAVNLAGIHCTDSAHCFTAGTSGKILKTTSGGAAWTILASTGITNHACIKMFDTTKIWTGKVNGTFHYTSNGGTTWAQVAPSPATTHVIYDIFFLDATNYLAVGGGPANDTTGGYVTLSTSNAGTSWTATNVSGAAGMYGIHCVNSTTCIACAGAQTIYKSTDGAQTWTMKHSGLTAALYDIDFPTSKIGYAVGGNPVNSTSLALKTTDGGETWTALPLVAPNVANGVAFTDSVTGYVVGKGGFIYKTSDGGLTWGSQVSPVTTDLTKVFFPTKNTGYISGAGGVVLKTIDAGGTVTAISQPASGGSFVILNNPSNVEVIIKLPADIQSGDLVILNALGQEIGCRRNVSGNLVPVHTSGLPSGIYFFRLSDSRQTIAGKFAVN